MILFLALTSTWGQSKKIDKLPVDSYQKVESEEESVTERKLKKLSGLRTSATTSTNQVGETWGNGGNGDNGDNGGNGGVDCDEDSDGDGVNDCKDKCPG